MSSFSIIAIAHKRAAKSILETVEMIAGKQQNIAAISFNEEMSESELMEVINNKIITLNQKDGILFLVDMYGGTPFKVAYSLSLKNQNYSIISGLNIPMLLEASIFKDSVSELSVFTEQVKSAGLNSIRTSNNSFVQNDFNLDE